jgi:hypothetical protein
MSNGGVEPSNDDANPSIGDAHMHHFDDDIDDLMREHRGNTEGTPPVDNLTTAIERDERELQLQDERIRLLELKARRLRNEAMIREREEEVQQLQLQRNLPTSNRRPRSDTLDRQFDNDVEHVRQRRHPPIEPPEQPPLLRGKDQRAKPTDPPNYHPQSGTRGRQALQDFLRACKTYRDLRPLAFTDTKYFITWCSQKLKDTAAQDWDTAVDQDGDAAYTWERFKAVLEQNLHPESTAGNYYLQQFLGAMQKPEQTAMSYFRYLNGLYLQLPASTKSSSNLQMKFASGLRREFQDEMTRFGDQQLENGKGLQAVAAQLDRLTRPRANVEREVKSSNHGRPIRSSSNSIRGASSTRGRGNYTAYRGTLGSATGANAESIARPAPPPSSNTSPYTVLRESKRPP